MASVYSDVTDDLGDSWSPPAWRKAGSGWFKRTGGLASPVRSRAVTPDKTECEFDGDEDLTEAADIPLPGSPTKGRSISRSLSPELTRQTPVSNIGKAIERVDSRYSSPPKVHHDKHDNNCKLVEPIP